MAAWTVVVRVVVLSCRRAGMIRLRDEPGVRAAGWHRHRVRRSNRRRGRLPRSCTQSGRTPVLELSLVRSWSPSASPVRRGAVELKGFDQAVDLLEARSTRGTDPGRDCRAAIGRVASGGARRRRAPGRPRARAAVAVRHLAASHARTRPGVVPLGPCRHRQDMTRHFKQAYGMTPARWRSLRVSSRADSGRFDRIPPTTVRHSF